MSVRKVLLSVTVVAVTVATVLSGQGVASASPVRPTYYVALGDSLSQGHMPGMDTDEGYVDDLYAQLHRQQPQLQLVKLGCSGETTTTMRTGGICAYDGAASQLDAAAVFLRAHRGAVRYVTLDIGANDVGGCVSATGIDLTCVDQGLTTISRNLLAILATVRLAGGFGNTQYAAMTYYDPYLAAWLLGPAGQAEARESVQISNVLNTIESFEYRLFGFRVADVSAAFHTNDFTVPTGQTLPLNVLTICQLTFMCTVGDIHATQAGYQLIAQTFGTVVRP